MPEKKVRSVSFSSDEGSAVEVKVYRQESDDESSSSATTSAVIEEDEPIQEIFGKNNSLDTALSPEYKEKGAKLILSKLDQRIKKQKQSKQIVVNDANESKAQKLVLF